MKYLVAPAKMPDELTWFKWEAYATWLSGFALTPKGILLDAPDHIPPNARLIGRNAAWSNAMPPKNVTEMTGEERALIAAWLATDRRYGRLIEYDRSQPAVPSKTLDQRLP